MSAIPYTIAALVLTGAACTASLATSRAEKPSEALVCALELSENQRQVTITASARAAQPLRGTYQLEIDQRSANGRSTIRQGGEFDLKSGEKATLGEARFSGRADEFEAELTIKANGQTKTCRSTTL
ncbi:curli-like amyloid fiber formation chaperone CsgH [Roseinatronobacter bogoriensis]|uniref:CsgH-like domain-containing protein n=1 Tax=Roseinatronobacter bogoriensis subsp. barguzinensis TaxID=441209 RepID=A0A2K8KC92_9RHOB|nr:MULTISPECIES: curli-like amyloid fiber formation chaperone CsgH [Rhodobaca]ATX67071.1 hypothetical protein BG454_15620 [Rhodobaca barguzinensis]MBB4206580.1 hypothetical protein [Rhodobaca bogoriensis DSM 18756]TDW41323.1 hypothetical protein LY39_00426 [Rhodobaca barguzinensis]TDY74499.1 hypothetical protein EV660_101539 [Rhodobaca bogoriensis DSM 18756]